jgi:heme/copper-type cytochrome/quinol oxidase subunit 2
MSNPNSVKTTQSTGFFSGFTNAVGITSPAPAPASTSDTIAKFFSDNMLVIIFISIILVIFLIVIIYIFVSMRGAGLRSATLSRAPIQLTGSNTPPPILATRMPVPMVGMEYAYSFWVYLENYSQTPGSQKMLWYRGLNGDLTAANPIVYLDSMSNKMYVVIKTKNSTLSSNNLGDIVTKNYFLNNALTLNSANTNKHIVMSYDYVPLQRWVNFGIAVDNKLVTLYMDGEIYSVKSVDEVKALRAPSRNVLGEPEPYNVIIDNTQGDINIGKNPMASQNITINGYVSKFQFFNYAITSNDMKRIYKTGPFVNSFLSLLGMGAYSLRSPVYKISASTNS